MVLNSKLLDSLRAKSAAGKPTARTISADLADTLEDRVQVNLLKDIAETLEAILETSLGGKAPPLAPTDKEIVTQLEPIKKWKFDVSRNREGQLTTIVATAIE